ncbi:hypothetical protein C1A_548 [Wolbachia endosymbiont of Culex quinquefasciatus JHB]|uniref:hypothetical protein n=1 Tax=unclassified Wolbachia TaxID=2640676 RepID=UPI0001761F19|nr:MULTISPECIES: hypothetical protein [unclassified Wolbachia]EEB56366.1 hypothetical protein C1A_548 [Wolbachia endosymbiont of Culex quinquefasciatus JHB]CAQ55092.1 Hypothetical protein WP0984 [Wolbachia endosymbiont of Culex quinquefasciatus Pel]CQD05148.1 Uncharacterised protein [Wolbachia endosymbiont wPip_Mol of Culex molestus]
MPNKSKINRELVKAFNSVLLSDNTAITNLTIEKDHVVLSFDKNMNIDQRREYLKNMRESIVEKFCGNERAANDLFYTDSFPFNFNQGKWTTDSSRHRFSVPIEKEVVCNLKYLLANELIRFTIESIIDDHPKGPDYVENNLYDVGFERKYYLYCKGFDDRELKDSFVKSFSSRMESYENSPKRFKGFLEEKGNDVYLKKGVFDDLKFVKDIVRHEIYLTCRCFDTPKGEIGVSDMLKFAVVDLLRKANIPVDRILRDSYLNSDEDSILIPIVSYNNNEEGYLTREEVNHVNNMFGMDILNSFEGRTSQKSLLGSKGVYGIDFANPDIAYCVMDKIIESSVINKDYKLSIDPARVPAMKPQILVPPEKVGTDGPSADTSADSGFGDSPKNSVIGKSHNGNTSKFLRPDYYGEGKGGDDASAKDSGFGPSSARSSFNKPEITFNQPSISQPDQCSAKKQTSTNKKSICCIL